MRSNSFSLAPTPKFAMRLWAEVWGKGGSILIMLFLFIEYTSNLLYNMPMTEVSETIEGLQKKLLHLEDRL